jgi:hypothetical protein
VLFLLALGLTESALLGSQRDGVATIFERFGWQMKIGTLATGIGLIGVLLAVLPYRPGRRQCRDPGRPWSAASVALAGLAGVMIVAFWRDALIPYLVVLALEFVRNALPHPAMSFDRVMNDRPADPLLVDHGLWQSLHERILIAGIESAVALAICMLTACWISRDLRSTTTPRTWPGLLYRFLSAIAAWASGAYLVLGALPRLHPALAEGFSALLYPSWTLLIVASFLGLSAGLAARGVARPPEFEDSTASSPATVDSRRLAWPLRLVAIGLKIAVVVVLVMIILAAITQIRGDVIFLPWYVPISVSGWLDGLSKPLTIGSRNATYLDPSLTPDALVVVAGGAWIGVLTLRHVLSRRPPGIETPLDRIGRDRRLLGRFLGTTLALTGVMLTLLPAFFLAGLAVLHLTLRLS